MSRHLPAWWRPSWFWSALVVLLIAFLATVSAVRGPAHPRSAALAAPTVPRGWEGHSVDDLVTVLSAPGPEGTTMRLVAANVGTLGSCLGVVISLPSIDEAEGANGNFQCDASVAAVVTDTAEPTQTTFGNSWEWQSRRTGQVWNGYFGTTVVGQEVHLLVGDTALETTPIRRHAYVSAATSALNASRTCVRLVFTDGRGTDVSHFPVAGDCPP